MAKKPATASSEPAVEPNARIIITDEDKSKAKKWFVRARELGDKRQFDVAIEYYIHGLEFWPEAVEEACKALHGCAVARKQTGGKKPGLKDTMTRSTSDKDPKQGFLNSLWLFAHEPDNVAYIEAVGKNAAKLRAEDAAKWIGGILQKAIESNSKTALKQFLALIELFDGLGDRAAGRGEHAFGVETYTSGVEVLRTAMRRFPKDTALESALKSLSTKLTILRGKYQDGDSYRDSITDTVDQSVLHDQDRSMQSDDRVDELIARAEGEHREDPNSPAKFRTLIDLLTRRERTDDETRAIGFLVSEYKRTNDYRFKMQADDIRIRQLGRESREIAKGGDKVAMKEAQIAQLRFELNAYKERVSRYPTDPRIKFEYAVRNFRAGRFDDAIPLFQAARGDPKNRAACGMYLGRCFYRNSYHSQAISTLQECIGEHEGADDDLGKTMRYWLGRSQEASGDAAAARQTFGNLLKLDYNYLDVRARLDALSAPG